MIEQLQQYLQRLTARERWIVLGGAIGVVLLIVIATVLPLQRSVRAAEHRVEKKRDDLVWLRLMAPQLSSLQTRAAPVLSESLIALVDRTARESGIAKSLAGPSQPSGDGGLSVRFEKMPFDNLVTWLSQLRERYGVRVESASVDAAPEPGMVTATLVLHAG